MSASSAPPITTAQAPAWMRWFMDARPGEYALITSAFGVLFGLVAAHTVMETARDAIFLGKLPANRLTIVYMVLALVGTLVPAYTGRVSSLFGRRDALTATLGIAALGTLVWHFQPATGYALYGLYLWSALLGTVLVVQYWLLSGHLFTVAQGKRLFAGIASGGVLGAVSGGLVATVVMDVGGSLFGQIDPRNLLLFAAAIYLGTALGVTTLPGDQPCGAGRARPTALKKGLQALREEPYVARLALLVAVSTAAVLVTDYTFKFAIKNAVAAEDLGVFFARYYVVLNSISLAVQLFVASRVLNRFGLIVSGLLLPVLLLGGASALFVVGQGLALALLLKGTDGSLRHSLHRVVAELLYLPLDGGIRERAKTIIDAVFVRGAQALAAAGLLALSYFGLESIRLLAGIVCVLVVIWIGVVLWLRRPYLELFRTALRRFGDTDLLKSARLDVDTVEGLVGAVSDPDGALATAAINVLLQLNRPRLISPLVMHHTSVAVIETLVTNLDRLPHDRWEPYVTTLMDRSDPALRGLGVQALAKIDRFDLVELALNDSSQRVRGMAALELAIADDADNPLMHPSIARIQKDVKGPEDRTAADDADRAAVLELFATRGLSKWIPLLIAQVELDGDLDDKFVSAVAGALAREPMMVHLEWLIEHLSVRPARGRVVTALSQLGTPALRRLEARLLDPNTRGKLRRQIPMAIAAFETPEATDILVERLDAEPDGAVRYRVLRALGRRVTESGVALPADVVELATEKNLLEHLRMLNLWLPLQDERPQASLAGVLVSELIEDKMDQALERTFRSFQLGFPREDVRSIYLALHQDDRRKRATALEFLDTLSRNAESRCRELLTIIADDLPPEERLRRARAHIPDGEVDLARALQLLSQDDDVLLARIATRARVVLGIAAEPSLPPRAASEAPLAEKSNPPLGFDLEPSLG